MVESVRIRILAEAGVPLARVRELLQADEEEFTAAVADFEGAGAEVAREHPAVGVVDDVLGELAQHEPLVPADHGPDDQQPHEYRYRLAPRAARGQAGRFGYGMA